MSKLVSCYKFGFIVLQFDFKKKFTKTITLKRFCQKTAINESIQKFIAEVIIPLCDKNEELISTQYFTNFKFGHCKWKIKTMTNDIINTVFALCTIFTDFQFVCCLCCAFVSVAERSFSTERRLKHGYVKKFSNNDLTGLHYWTFIGLSN